MEARTPCRCRPPRSALSERPYRRRVSAGRTADPAGQARRTAAVINSRYGILMIGNERLPALAPGPVTTPKILAYRRLGHVKAQLEQLTVDTRRTPQRIVPSH